MKVIYSGPQPTRTVELGPGNAIDVEHGKPFEVDPQIGKKLVRQRHFAEESAAAPPPKPPAAQAGQLASPPAPATPKEKE